MKLRKMIPYVRIWNLLLSKLNDVKKIVGGLLNFARKSQVCLVETNMVDFVKQSLTSIIKPENVELIFEYNTKKPFAYIDVDQMMQALTNLENAVEANAARR